MRFSSRLQVMMLVTCMFFPLTIYSQESDENTPKQPAQPAKPSLAAPVSRPVVTPVKPVAATTVKASTSPVLSKDTLIIIARLVEIPGKFPPNDLYNYVFIMKYRVVKVFSGPL